MSLFAKLFFFAFLFALTQHGQQAQACSDGTLYKQCQDQTEIFNTALAKAKTTNKTLVVTLGYETCPWCQSLGKMFHGFTADNSAVSARYEFVEIAAYSYDKFAKTFDEVPSGLAVSQRLLSQLETKTDIAGYPVIFVVSPKNSKIVMVETGSLEEKDDATGIEGHDEQKVLEALSQARVRTLSVE